MKILEFIATVGTLIGLYYISEGNIQGFTISMLSNIAWLAWAYHTNANGVLLVNAIMIFLNLNGLGVI